MVGVVIDSNSTNLHFYDAQLCKNYVKSTQISAKSNCKLTVWKFQNLTANLILREINFGVQNGVVVV